MKREVKDTQFDRTYQAVLAGRATYDSLIKITSMDLKEIEPDKIVADAENAIAKFGKGKR